MPGFRLIHFVFATALLVPPDAADGDAGDDQAALESKEEVTSLALATPVKSAIELTGPVPDDVHGVSSNCY